MKKLNIGLIGCGFMGRTHSNASRKVNNFFDLEYQPVLKAVCDLDEARAKLDSMFGGSKPEGEPRAAAGPAESDEARKALSRRRRRTDDRR